MRYLKFYQHGKQVSFRYFFLKVIFYFQGRFAPAVEGSKINLGFLAYMAMRDCILPAFFCVCIQAGASPMFPVLFRQ